MPADAHASADATAADIRVHGTGKCVATTTSSEDEVEELKEEVEELKVEVEEWKMRAKRASMIAREREAEEESEKEKEKEVVLTPTTLPVQVPVLIPERVREVRNAEVDATEVTPKVAVADLEEKSVQTEVAEVEPEASRAATPEAREREAMEEVVQTPKRLSLDVNLKRYALFSDGARKFANCT